MWFKLINNYRVRGDDRMLFNQVVFIVDDVQGSGLLLTERFLLEESKVILCTNDVVDPLSR
ncbi:MAG: hypothetical protein JWN30_1790, partial [Bacilli bacterium]|nr:hypothetical protein [Bacilli bacterium]